MVLFRNSPPASGQVGVNHVFGVTGLESLVRHTVVCLRAMPLISLNLRKMAHFWIGNLSMPYMKPQMGVLTVVAAGDTDSIMCDRGVFAIGDFSQTVQDKWGEPDKKEGKIWRYNFGPSLPVYTVEFDENSNVVRIVEDQGGSP